MLVHAHAENHFNFIVSVCARPPATMNVYSYYS